MTAATVTAPREIRPMLVALARREAPRECCGLLLGSRNRIQFALPARNRASSRTRFQLDPRTHFEAQRLARRLIPALAVVGVFHSHPSGAAFPSERDVAEAHYPDWVHVIVGLGRARPEVSAFRISQGRIRRLRLRWQ